MATVQDISSQEEQLKAQLAQLAADKLAATEQAKQEKLGLITTYENEAEGFRNQAAKATSETEKQKLYRFAVNSDNLAAELRGELGLEPVLPVESPYQDNRIKVLRKINGLAIKSIFALAGFLFTDFTASQLEAGFISYVLQAASQILFFLTSSLFGIWLVCSILLRFVSGYIVSDLAEDFTGLKPLHKLLILVAIGAALLHFFNAAIPHGI